MQTTWFSLAELTWCALSVDSRTSETVQANPRTSVVCAVTGCDFMNFRPRHRERRAWWNRGVTPRPLRTALLSADQQAAVLALVAAAEEADGVPPLSEQSRLAVRGRSGHAVEHLLAYADDRPRGVPPGGRGVRASSWWRRRTGAPAWGLPCWTRCPPGRGCGPTGTSRPPSGSPRPEGSRWSASCSCWAGGSTRPGRWTTRPCPTVSSPAPFRPGRDEDEWLRVNAAAFAHHAEQGRMTRADLDARMDEPWFDPAGLILVVPESDPDTVAAFHWTKRRSENARARCTSSGSTPHTRARGWAGR